MPRAAGLRRFAIKSGLRAEGGAGQGDEPCRVDPHNASNQASAPVRRTKQKPEVDSSVASLLQNDVQGARGFFGLCPRNDKAEREDSSGIRPQNGMKKDVILSVS